MSEFIDKLIYDLAAHLLEICSFRHGDGRLYRDDALDTFSLLYPDYCKWDDLEAKLVEIAGEEYWNYRKEK